MSVPRASARASRTLFAWGWYTFVLGATLNVAPNVLLALFGIAPTTEVWIRLVGMFLFFIAYLSFSSARSGNAEYMKWSAHIRLSVPLFFTSYVALGMAPPTLLLFAVVDVAAALWTLAALKADGNG